MQGWRLREDMRMVSESNVTVKVSYEAVASTGCTLGELLAVLQAMRDEGTPDKAVLHVERKWYESKQENRINISAEWYT